MRRWATLAVATGVGLLGLTVVASAAPPAVPLPVGPSESDPTRPGSLDLSIRARSLGLVLPETPDTLGLGTMRAPTGAGTTRMPSAVTELAPHVYLYVTPSCLPGEDGFLPGRPPAPRRR